MTTSRANIADLRRIAAGVIRSQGNRFVKELLRKEGVKIGDNKDQFEKNLSEAIEEGKITVETFGQWLKEVEGWGNQHVYLFRILPSLRKELTAAKLRQSVRAAGFDKIWNGDTVLAFPDEPELTSISFIDSVLSLVWQEASPGWTPVPEKNFIKEEGLDTFEYRAWRKIERRAITRFEAHVEKDLAGLFIADPIQGAEHQTARATVTSSLSTSVLWKKNTCSPYREHQAKCATWNTFTKNIGDPF